MASGIKWKPAPGKTWRMKLEAEHPNHGKVVPIPESMRHRYGEGSMLIPSPRDVDALIRRVRKGRLATPAILRAALAKAAGADAACPMTTGIFVLIAAHAAEEDRRAGRKRITPWWRIIKEDGKLNPKFPRGAAGQVALLRAEGFTLIPGKGAQPPRVRDFEGRLTRLDR